MKTKMEMNDIINNIKDLIKVLDRQILEIPTGNIRNNLANANIFLMSAVDELKSAIIKVKEYDKKTS